MVEEFGLARDAGSYAAGSTTALRDIFYRRMCRLIAGGGRAAAGLGFWAWGGEGRPSRPRSVWKAGDALLGDPPHELQGWYSVYDTDASTLVVIAQCSHMLQQAAHN